ncbi:1,4-beta-xylanase, partial [Streptomyces sp. S.PB5]|nr:1,4-beta-xylanase [Streptomyces sp. S.PB5]
MGLYALPGPGVRRRIRSLLLVLLVGVLSAAAAVVTPSAAHAAESTLGAAAAQSGRYFGTAIASGRLGDSA